MPPAGPAHSSSSSSSPTPTPIKRSSSSGGSSGGSSGRGSESGIVALLRAFHASGFFYSAGGHIREKVSSPRLEPLRLSVRAGYGHQQQQQEQQQHPGRGLLLFRPLPLMSIWALALLFVGLIVIPDLNRRLTSLPVHSTRSLLTSEIAAFARVGRTAGQGAGASRGRSKGADVKDGRPAQGEDRVPGKSAASDQGAEEAVLSKQHGKVGTGYLHGGRGEGGGATLPGGVRREGQKEAKGEAQHGARKQLLEGAAAGARAGATVKVLATEEEAFWLDPATDGGGVGVGVGQGASGERKLRESAEEAEPWPNKLILALATGYSAENVSAIVKTFQRFIGGARLVLFVDQPVRGWTPHKGVLLQPFHKPQAGLWSRLPLWLVRFRVYKLFLETVKAPRELQRHSTVIFCDARDVAFLGDPFPLFRNATAVYLFQESTAFPPASAKKMSNNHKWVSMCFGRKWAMAFAGKRVVNAGFMAGSVPAMVKLAGAVARQAEQLSEQECLLKWGADQAILNYLVRSGSLLPTVPFILENNEHGAVLQRFSRKAIVQVATRLDSEESEPSLRNKDGRPVLAIHGYDRYSDTHDVIKQLV